MKAKVPQDLDGARLDRIVAVLGGVSRAVAGQVADSGGVVVDGEVAWGKLRVGAGSVIEFEIPTPPEVLVAEDVAFGVRFEDAHLAVVDKPAGVVVHPGAGRASGTLAAGILHRWPSVRGVGDDGRWGIVHRLDRDTSGLMVVALDRGAYDGLRQAIAARSVTRKYLALVHGTPPTPTGTIDAPIARDPMRPTRMRLQSTGRPARTHYRVEKSWGRFTLLGVTLETGRTHQIRVHLGSIGLPIAGDRTYGRPGGSPRVFLHACHLGFDHPISGERIEIESPLPADLARALADLGAPDEA